jgi:ABC-type phosphate transport system substrate-binding protein
MGLRVIQRLGGTVFAMAVLSAPLPAAADILTVQGSTTFNSRLMEPFRDRIEAASGHVLNVIPNKSGNGLIAVLEGRADLAMISAPLSDEIKLLQKTRPDLPYNRLSNFEIANTRVAFAVHPANSVRQVPLETIGRILLGHVKNWHELGGPDLPIRPVFVRTAGGVTHAVTSRLLGGKTIAAPEAIAVESPMQVIKVVEQEPGALGFAQLALVREHHLPELETGDTVEQQLNLVTLGEPTPAMQAVIHAARAVAAQKLALAR